MKKHRIEIGGCLLAALLMMAGCSTAQPDTLPLENVLDMKAQKATEKKVKSARKARRAVLEAKEKKEEEAAAKKAQQIVKKVLTPQEIVAHSTLNPPELSLFELPADFSRITDLNQESSDLQKIVGSTYAESALLWKAAGLDLAVMAWKVPMDAQQFKSLSKEEFRAILNHDAEELDAFYKTTRQSRAYSEIIEKDQLTVMKITSKFLDSNIWRTHVRYVLFYRPDYRLNIMISANDDDLAKKSSEINSSFDSFLKKWSELLKEEPPTSVTAVPSKG